MSSFDFFDRVYCIHLPNEQRMRHMREQFERAGIQDVRYVNAAEPPPAFTVPNMRRNPRAEFGVNLSHVLAIATAIEERASRPLFVEDDVVFTGALPSLPFYDVLYLGGHPRGQAELIAPNLARVGKFSCAEAYSVRREQLLHLLWYWLDRITQPNAMYDFILGEFAAERVSYCVYPVITEQARFISHIRGTVDDKRKLVERGWQNNLSTK